MVLDFLLLTVSLPIANIQNVIQIDRQIVY